MKNTTQPAAAAPSISVENAPRFNLRPDGSVELIRPLLELHGDIQWNKKDIRTLERKWRPERAVIVNGIVIIEEWSLFLPLSYLHVGRWESDAAPRAEKTS